MVVGNGMIARAAHRYAGDNNFIIFASGVSNSKCTVQAEFEREFNLLKQTAQQKGADTTLVYFSTCSIEDPSEQKSEYVAHKKEIEQYIQANVNHYVIFRVSNIVGGSGNANTILNFIVHSIKEGRQFGLWSGAVRNLIGVDDFFGIADYVLQRGLFSNQIVNIANPESYPVTVIVACVERHLNKAGNFTLVNRGEKFEIDIAKIKPVIDELGITFGNDYLKGLLAKYYPTNHEL